MNQPRIVKSFFRIAKTFPPSDEEYLTAQQRRGDPGENVPEHIRASWDGISAYDTEDGARRKARAARKTRRPLGELIVRFDIPEGAEITWQPSLGPGHFDLRGDAAELKRYLSDEFSEV